MIYIKLVSLTYNIEHIQRISNGPLRFLKNSSILTVFLKQDI